MRTKNIYDPYIGQEWAGTDSKVFKIIDMIIQEDDAWVSYKNTQTNTQYSCRLEAFKHRFTPLVD